MIQVRYAKSAMENEEGMNHLWIQMAPPGQCRMPACNSFFRQDFTGRII